MDLNHAESHEPQAGTSRSWIIGLTSLAFVILQSACSAVVAISGLRLIIGLTSLAAASAIPGFVFAIHADRIRLPMLIVAILGSVLNLYALWRIRSLRLRPASQWRVQLPTNQQRRSETLQLVISLLTLALVVTECLVHHHLHGSF